MTRVVGVTISGSITQKFRDWKCEVDRQVVGGGERGDNSDE